ncbi:hypothetical protein GCM10010140_63340 [Streptosporangium pseudovulgare]|uniref:Uncharacterized protein n=1 Tax=Streptosporangium pseudovulgare TaxID=35765 RepID=A0ABQ2REZ8_9ACTN|nr:hypothetical protein GCM10010140_63340 [Streptosporangium pseudovulgare]
MITGDTCARAAVMADRTALAPVQRIADALSARVEAEQREAKKQERHQDDDDDGNAGALTPVG